MFGFTTNDGHDEHDEFYWPEIQAVLKQLDDAPPVNAADASTQRNGEAEASDGSTTDDEEPVNAIVVD